jgi:hypothetical protein
VPSRILPCHDSTVSDQTTFHAAAMSRINGKVECLITSITNARFGIRVQTHLGYHATITVNARVDISGPARVIFAGLPDPKNWTKVFPLVTPGTIAACDEVTLLRIAPGMETIITQISVTYRARPGPPDTAICIIHLTG